MRLSAPPIADLHTHNTNTMISADVQITQVAIMSSIPGKAMAEFVAACRRVAAHGLVKCSSGNLSYRLDAERALVTTTRSWLADLTEREVSLVRISDGASLSRAKPSVETRFHLGILRQRPEVNVVLHFQSPAATTLACGQPDQVNYFVIPEIPYYIGPIAVVPFLDPGSAALAEAVIPAMKTHNLAILTNHGQVAVGKDYHEAVQRAVFFELACEIILRGGNRVQPLNDEAVVKLLPPV
jgi:ribulose-5-phosphate 4-epimerase/fuculose-1-phosphate aldolase